MSGEGQKYQYEGLPKGERLELASQDGRLERHRFVLSDDPALREKLKILREVFKKAKDQYPLLVDISLYGSHTKGYAIPESDIEGTIFIDLSKQKGARTMKDGFDAGGILKEMIEERLQLGKGQSNLGYQFINIDNLTTDLMLRRMYSGEVSEFFRFSIGNGLQSYREKIISHLEETGSEGKQLWENIVEELWKWENYSFSEETKQKRKSLYPWDLSKARSFFGLPKRESASGNQP